LIVVVNPTSPFGIPPPNCLPDVDPPSSLPPMSNQVFAFNEPRPVEFVPSPPVFLLFLPGSRLSRELLVTDYTLCFSSPSKRSCTTRRIVGFLPFSCRNPLKRVLFSSFGVIILLLLLKLSDLSPRFPYEVRAAGSCFSIF